MMQQQQPAQLTSAQQSAQQSAQPQSVQQSAQPGHQPAAAPENAPRYDRVTEIPVKREIVRTVPVKKVVEVPREILEPVHTVETRTIDQEIEVLGEVVQVPKPFLIENKVLVPRFVDFKVPTVVSQTMRPTFVESSSHAVEVRLREYVPELVPVSVFVPRPIERSLVVAGDTQCSHAPVDVPLPQFNALVRDLNRDREAVLAAHPHVAQAYRQFEQLAEEEHRALLAETTHHTDDNNRAVALMAQLGNELRELASASEAKDSKFWMAQMLTPAADGTVPALPEVQEIVFPQNDDWKRLPATSGVLSS